MKVAALEALHAVVKNPNSPEHAKARAASAIMTAANRSEQDEAAEQDERQAAVILLPSNHRDPDIVARQRAALLAGENTSILIHTSRQDLREQAAVIFGEPPSEEWLDEHCA